MSLATLQKPLLPKTKIVSTPSYVDTNNKEELIKRILDKNEYIKSVADKDGETFEFIFSYSHQNHKTIILKCSPNIRDAIHKNNHKIKIGFSLCKVYDRIHVPQCSKCCRFGYTFRNCSSDTQACSYCAKNHVSKECSFKNTIEKHQCINCHLSKNNDIKSKANTHNAFSFDCPNYCIEKNRIISRTDFGVHTNLPEIRSLTEQNDVERSN